MLDIRLTAMSPQRLTVEIEDNGRGLPEGFTLAASDSLGLRIATMLAQQMGGNFTLARSGVGSGALARLELPLAPA